MHERFLSSEEYDERAHTLYNEGDYDGALSTLKEGLALYPNAVELYVGLGYARMAREEFAWARMGFEQALILDPTHEDALVGMGEVLLRLGEAKRSLALFAKVQELGFADDVELMLTMGRALYREGLFPNAREVFSRLISLRPESAEAMASMAYAVHRMGDEIGACRQIRRALRMSPDLHEARVYLAHLLYDRGDWEGALREFERVPPPEHWDPLALWRLLELKRAVLRWPDNDPRLAPWSDRLSELEVGDEDPIEQLLAEVEAQAAGEDGWYQPDENQLELFQGGDGESPEATRIRIVINGGKILRGTAQEVVRQLREESGFSHEPLQLFMKRMAERYHEQHGFEVPSHDPRSFLTALVTHGLAQVLSGDEPS